MSRVDMEIGKFEYCNPLHKPVMLLLHYLGRTYLSFIMYRASSLLKAMILRSMSDYIAS